MKLDRKIAVVTGGGQGIGQAIALSFAKEGAYVVVYDVNIERAKSVVREIKSMGRQALAIKGDVSNSADVNQMVEKALARFKKIDILVNNAGISGSRVLAEDLTETQWDSIMGINLKGQFLCSQAVGKQMFKQKHGKIINIASLAGHAATPRMLPYAVSKAGVLQLTKTLAIEWAKYNINVNAVSPGITITPMWDELKKSAPDFLEARLKSIPLKRAAQPEDIANTVLFLACPESDNITGQTIIVDGGCAAINPAHVMAIMEHFY